MTLVYIICKDEKEAEKISRHLLKKKLIACANMFPVNSMYWWEGKMQSTKEVGMFVKTHSSKFEAVKNKIEPRINIIIKMKGIKSRGRIPSYS